MRTFISNNFCNTWAYDPCVQHSKYVWNIMIKYFKHTCCRMCPHPITCTAVEGVNWMQSQGHGQFISKMIENFADICRICHVWGVLSGHRIIKMINNFFPQLYITRCSHRTNDFQCTYHYAVYYGFINTNLIYLPHGTKHLLYFDCLIFLLLFSFSFTFSFLDELIEYCQQGV